MERTVRRAYAKKTVIQMEHAIRANAYVKAAGEENHVI